MTQWFVVRVDDANRVLLSSDIQEAVEDVAAVDMFGGTVMAADLTPFLENEGLSPMEIFSREYDSIFGRGDGTENKPS